MAGPGGRGQYKQRPSQAALANFTSRTVESAIGLAVAMVAQRRPTRRMIFIFDSEFGGIERLKRSKYGMTLYVLGMKKG